MSVLGNKNLSTYINLSRWLAAFLVVIQHVRDLVLIDYQYTAVPKSLFSKLIYFITAFGHESVIVFFVISGFLVGGLTLERWHKSGVSMSSYAKARFSRIYTVLIPALIFGYVLDYIGLNWCNSSELYTNSSIYKTISLNYSINSSLNLLTFIGNIFMTQEILVSHLGSNGPLWSLAYEWWYYCIFALISAALLNSGITRVVYGILGLALLLILPGKLILWGSIWLVGVVSAILIAKFNMPAHPILIFTAFLVVIIVARFSHSMDIFRVSPLISWFARDFFFSIFFAFTLFAANQIKKELPFSRINHRLAEFSFSIYLYHFPFLIFVTALTYQHFGIHFQLQPAFGSYLYCVALTSFIYLYCYLCYSITERYTPYIRLRLDSWTAKLVNSVRSRLVG